MLNRCMSIKIIAIQFSRSATIQKNGSYIRVRCAVLQTEIVHNDLAERDQICRSNWNRKQIYVFSVRIYYHARSGSGPLGIILGGHRLISKKREPVRITQEKAHAALSPRPRCLRHTAVTGVLNPLRIIYRPILIVNQTIANPIFLTVFILRQGTQRLSMPMEKKFSIPQRRTNSPNSLWNCGL